MAYNKQHNKLKGFHDENKNQFLHNKIKPSNFDQSDCTMVKHTDSNEIRELKTKMNLVMNKLTTTKKEKEQLFKQNKSMQEEIITMQSNLRHMIPGFANTSSNFPIHNQLVVKIAEFYKYDCLDKFFDLLCPELSMKGILYFYSTCFSKMNALIHNYMNPAFNSLMKVGCFNTLQGPIMNVLRKSFQVNQKKIFQQIFTKQAVMIVVNDLQIQMNLGNSTQETNQQIMTFLIRLGQLILCCFISDPPLSLDLTSIGKKVLFNPLKHDPFDGFIKPKEECWVVLPQVRRGIDSNQMLSKGLVLQTSYDIAN